ncbi:glucuronate isomerase [Halobacillus litoralis]|uniref:Uronate isomerase n=1 Tax=Halobacillus litoralis TaxID=45668 RepID=A0A845EDF5_9BACI|nr:glucuronate isomerase [Halobacillus litoralis]MYL49278.1 glucuronate isomerase [Halobacillus litoralis]
MSNFIPDDFLLTNDVAKRLYHDFAKDLPIIDFHNHLPPDEISKDVTFETLTDIWLGGDHYKWRLMRANGIDEHYITGHADAKEKFKAWAETVPNTLGNPLFHWTHMELKRYFGIDDYLNSKTADRIWDVANEKLQSVGMSTQQLLKKDRVEFVGTTDDPTDELTFHKELQNENHPFQVAPSFRPDPGLKIDKEDFNAWVQKLSEVTNKNIQKYTDFLDGLAERVDYFDNHGCKASDHGIDEMFYAQTDEKEVAGIFDKKMRGESLTNVEVEKYKTFTLQFLASLYNQKGWIMQLHIGAMRNNNTKMLERIGRDTGYDSPGDRSLAKPLSHMLDSIEYGSGLPKTILYCLNPKDYYVMATIAGNHQDGSTAGKIQFGTAWWFNDHIDGMENQMKILANVGLIKHFVGMLTDSRSFLSFSRHEYFRRILCNLFGTWAQDGKVPSDVEWLGAYVKDISYYNAKEYFGLKNGVIL